MPTIKIITSRQTIIDGVLRGPVARLIAAMPDQVEAFQAALDAREVEMQEHLSQHQAHAAAGTAKAIAAAVEELSAKHGAHLKARAQILATQANDHPAPAIVSGA